MKDEISKIFEVPKLEIGCVDSESFTLFYNYIWHCITKHENYYSVRNFTSTVIIKASSLATLKTKLDLL